jgi:hypothetical protein
VEGCASLCEGTTQIRARARHHHLTPLSLANRAVFGSAMPDQYADASLSEAYPSQKSAAFVEPLIEARPGPFQAFDTESVKKLAVHATNGLRVPVKVVVSGDAGVGKVRPTSSASLT